jgi:hypothetical protein
VQSPGKERLLNRTVEPELKDYVRGVVGAFAKDDRILAGISGMSRIIGAAIRRKMLLPK